MKTHRGFVLLMVAGFAVPRLLAADASAPASFKFQLADSALPGAILVKPDMVFSTERGWGFEPGANVTLVPAKDGAPGAATSAQPFAFSVTVPEGNYRVSVTLGNPANAATTTVKSESRRLELERIKTDAGKSVTKTFTVNVRGPAIAGGGEVNLDPRERNPETKEVLVNHWDGKLTLTFSDTHPAVSAIDIEKADDATTVFVLGDSTVTDQPRGPNSSWGQMLPRWFGPQVAVANHAESGETLRGFLRERRWDKVLSQIKPGDVVLIQFGTNDSKRSGPQNIYPGQDFSETYAPADTLYKELLKQFVADAQKKGALPVIVSSPARRNETDTSSLGEYAAAAMAAAQEAGVPGIDLNAMGRAMNQSLGADNTRLFADQTHHSDYGAYMLAKCVVLGLQQKNAPVAKFVVADFGQFDPAQPAPTPANYDVPPDAGGRGGNAGGRRGGRRGGQPPAPAAFPPTTSSN